MARNDEFNREMGSYLRQRRVIKRTNPLLAARKYLKGMFAPREQQREQEPLDIPPEQVQAVIAQNSIKQSTRTTKVVPRVAPVAAAVQRTQPRRNNIMGWFSRKQEEYEEVEPVQQQPTLDEDVREVLKITFKWLKQMDPDQVDEIKRSPDFEKYKAVLDKYGLIKK